MNLFTTKVTKFISVFCVTMFATMQMSAQITTDLPTTSNYCVGSTINLSVVATNATTYQWYKNGAIISGQTTATYTKTSTALSDAGSYFVIVNGLFGVDTSETSVLSVKQPVAITTQPTSTQTLCVGSSFNLSVAATGEAPLSYQWKKAGADILGATSSTFNIPIVATTDAAAYTVAVTGSVLCPTVTSNNATLVVQTKPIITTQPAANTTICQGATLNLTAAATGIAPYTYVWKRNGTTISGATTTTYSKTNTTQASDAGTYTFEVKDASVCTAVPSSNAVVTINLKPSITAGITGNSPVCVGGTLTLNATAANNASVAWFKGATQVSTSASYSTTATTADAGSYTFKAIANTGCTDTTSGAYTVVVNTPPSITTQPVATTTICEGGTINLSVVAAGTAPLTYLWKKNGSTISGATSSTFSKSNATQASDSGTYTVVVSGASPCAAATSSNAVVTINKKPAITVGIAGTTPVCVGSSISLSATTTNSSNTIWYLNGTQVGTGATYTKTAAPADAGSYTVKAVANTGCTDTTSSSFTQVVQNKVQITTQPDSVQNMCEGSAIVLSVAATGMGTLSYQWKKGSTNIGTNTNSIIVSNVAALTDAGTYSVVISDASACAPVTSNNAVINVSPKPVISAGPSGTPPFCVGATLTLNATATNAANIVWFKNGVQVGTGATFSKTATLTDSGSYTVKAEGNIGCPDTTSGAYTVAINTPPTVTTPPIPSQTICEGASLNLSVVGSGTAPLTYQWKKGSSNIPGANAATYSVPSTTQIADAGSYSVSVGDASGCLPTLSSNAIVTINKKPAITVGIAGTTPLCLGNSISLSATTTNAASTIWYKGTDSVGTGATYTKTATVSDAGSYTVKAKAATGCTDTTSGAFTLAINTPPSITTQPTATQTICEGAALNLSVTAAGTAPLTYQWKKGGTDIVGATTSTYTVSSPTQAADAGTYSVVVTGASPCATVTSANAIVTINKKPAITVGISGTNPLCLGNSISLSATTTNAVSTIWYKGMDSVGTGTTFTKTATVSDAGSYTVKAKAATGCTDTTSSAFTLAINTPPSITTQPTASQTLCEGATLNLGVTAAGTAPLTYQWKLGGTNIGGANGSTYTVPSVSQAADSGTYTVVVTGASPCATVTSANAVVIINKKPTVSVAANGSTNICLGAALGITATASGATAVEWKRGTTSVLTGSGPSLNYVVTSSTLADSGKYYFYANGMTGCNNILLDSIVVNISKPVVISTEPTATQTLCEGTTLNLNVVATGTMPFTYVWRKNGTIIPGSTANYTKTNISQANDTGTYTVEVSGSPICPSDTSANAVVNINLKPSISPLPSGTTPLCVGNPISISSNATNVASIEWKKAGSVIATTATYSKPAAAVSDSGVYTFVAKALTGCSDSMNTFTLVVKSPPVITVQPLDTTICEGKSFTLGVTATGTAPFTYLWKRNSATTPITNSSFTVNNATQTLAQGAYTVEITGAAPCAVVTSNVANVVVNLKPIPTTPTGLNNLCIGDPINLTASASNMDSIEWYRGATKVGSGTTFSKAPSVLSDSGFYSIKAKALKGCVDSSSAALNVTLKTPATITTEPTATQTKCVGNSLSLSVVATGEGTLSYQWRKNGVSIPFTTSTLSIPSLADTDSGTYTCIVTNTGFCNSSDTSANAIVIVNKKPVISTAVSGTNNICLGSSINLTGATSNTASIEWKRGSTVVGTSIPYSVAASTYADSGNYTLVAKALTGCVDTVSGNYNVKINTPVTITTQPTVTQTLCEGNNLALSVVASGQAPLTYVWKRNTTIVGSSLPNYSVTGITQSTDTGTYTVAITGSSTCPTVTSANAVVLINKKPVISVGIAGNNTLCLGDSLGLTVTATNISGIDWKKAGVTVGSGALFTKKPTIISDAGAYNIVAKALPGCIDSISGNYTVTINTPTSIFIPPVAQTKCEGDSLLVGVVANGTGPFSYVWRKNGAPISGAPNAAIYRKGNITVSDTGKYSVIVTGASPCPSVLSDSGLVSINKKPALTGIAGPNSICLGSALNLTTTYSNATDIEWYKDSVLQFNGFNAYQLFSAILSDSGNYQVKIKALPACTDTMTPNFVVKVKNPVTISTQPLSSQTLCLGSTANMNVVATGDSILTYVWRKNLTPISGEVASTLTKTNVAVSDSGNYTVIVKGASACPSITSTISRLNVNPKPTITTQPSAVATSICLGDSIRLTGAGANNSLIEWRRNGVTVGFGSVYRKSVTTIADSGTYLMVVKGLTPCGDTISNPVVISISNPVIISTQPTPSQTLCEGNPLILKVTATGTGTLTYAWKKNNVSIGSTLDSFTKASVLVSDTGNYTVSITGASVCPVVTSNIARLNINLQPKITTQPNGVNNICLGDSIRFTAAASNASSIEWKKGTSTVGTGAVYSKLISTIADTGSYYIVAKGMSPCMDSTSTSIDLTINNPVVISTQPTATQTLCEGNPLNLKVVATGSGTLTYDWKKNNSSIGSTLDSFAKNAVTVADTGNYTVAITGASVCPTVNSNIGRVNVNLQPMITTQPNGINTICLGDSIHFSAVASNVSSIEWKRGTTTVGSGSIFSKLVSAVSDSGSYSIVAKGMSPCMDSMSSPLVLTIKSPVVIATQPITPVTLCEGNTLDLKVVASGSDTLKYQWKKNGTDISGATLDSLMISNVTNASDTGSYAVAITGASVCPTVMSDVSIVSINLKPTIASAPMGTSQVCLDSMIMITSNATNNSGIEWFKNGVSVATTTDLVIPVAAYTDSAYYTYKALALPSCVDTMSDSFKVTVNTPISIVSQPTVSQTLCEGNPLVLKVVAAGTGPYTYQWKKGGVDISGATLDSFNISSVSSSDAAAYTCNVSGISVCYSVLSNGATVIVNSKPVITQNPMTSSILCAGNSLSLTSVSLNKSQVEWFKDGVSVGTGDNYTVPVSSTSNSGLYHYKLVALTSCVDTFSDTFRVFISNPVVISTQPIASQSLCKGSAFNLFVAASSNVPLTYQWFKDGNLLAGKTDSFISIASVDISDLGVYSVDVLGSVSCPAVTSNTSNLVVNLPPSIVSQPSGQSPVCEGGKILLNATVSDYTSLEWRKGSTVLVTSDSFVKTNVTSADSGSYNFVVKALPGCRDTTSTVFVQSINKAAVITTNPISTKLISGKNLSYVLKVGVTGTGPFAYQWYRNTLPIAGATSDTFKIFNFTTMIDSGIYYCAVTGPAPCNTTLNSNTASVYPSYCPMILRQPKATSVVACIGDTLDLSVYALDATYQWVKGGSAISFATDSHYTVAHVTGDEAGLYLCNVLSVNNPTCPPVASDTVNVSVTKAPAITLQPLPNKVCSTTSHVLKVGSTDASIYQWYLDSVMISGATSDTFTVSPLGSVDAIYSVKVTNPYCSPKMSNSVNVRNVNPSSQVVLKDSSNFDLVEQCTDTLGWTYYSTALKTDEFLLAIRKKSNVVTFSPDVEVLSSVKEVSPNNIENKGALFGSRLFNIDVVAGDVNSSTYDVKFYYSTAEFNTIVGRFNDIKFKLGDSFTTTRPLNVPSFITSTQEPFTSTLLSNISMPANFYNTIVSLQDLGVDNNVNYVVIKDLVADNGGGTLYFDYFKKAKFSSIATVATSDLNINLYPVPSMGDLTVEINNPILKVATIEVYDLMGKVVYSENVRHSTENSKHNLDLNHLSNGTYSVKVIIADSESTSRFTIVR